MNFKPLLLLLACISASFADVPRKAAPSRYSRLWSDSPFTAKPPVEGPVAPVNPLEDYTLLGVTSIGPSEYRVTIVDKKAADAQRVYVESNKSNPQNMQILSVTHKTGDPLSTTVKMSTGSMTGTVTFDQQHLVLAKGAPPVQSGNPNPNQIQPPPIQPGGIPQPGNLPNGATPRQPRPRVIPPPPQPGAIPQPQPQQANPQNPQNVRIPRRQ